MKKPKFTVQYRWKIKVQGKKAIKKWGRTYRDAMRHIMPSLAKHGYQVHRVRNGSKMSVVRVTNQQNNRVFPSTTKIVYIVRLNIKRNYVEKRNDK